MALVKGRHLVEWRSYNTPAFYRQHSSPHALVQADASDEAGMDGIVEGSIHPVAGRPIAHDATAPLSMPGTQRPAEKALIVDFEGLGFSNYRRISSTGYGRNRLAVNGARVVSEVLAHAAGAAAQTGLADFINLDMGGQDFKLNLVLGGRVTDMAANPRCAASSGRFLEAMAEVLELGLDEMGAFWEDPLPMDSTCSVYAETEVVGLLSEGHPVERIAAGVNLALVRKLLPHVGPFLEKAEILVFTGGCARSEALRRLLEQQLRLGVIVPPEPEANGAYGCTLVEP